MRDYKWEVNIEFIRSGAAWGKDIDVVCEEGYFEEEAGMQQQVGFGKFMVRSSLVVGVDMRRERIKSSVM